MKLRTLFYVGLTSLFFLASCKTDDNDEALTCTKEYDQTQLLVNILDDIIVPSYSQLNNDLTALQISINNLITEPTDANFEEAKSDFVVAYTTFQHTSHFEFGPALDVDFRANLNNFPPNIDAVNANLASGVFDFDAVDADQNYDKGFPALDYFLYGYENLLEDLVDNDYLKAYLSSIVFDMVNRTNTVVEGWNTSEKFDFRSNQGTSAGSSLSTIINVWNENYELAKRQKIGDPSGVNALGIVYPEGVEAYYSGLSLDLAKASLQASRAIFEGVGFSSGVNGEGLDDLLSFVDAQKDGTALQEVIANQFDLTLERLNAINGTLAEAIETDNATAQAAYAAYSQQVIHTKTDMPSILCISITYVDNPSDSD